MSLFRKSTNLLQNSRMLVWVVAGILFLLGVLQVAQGFIDTRDVRDFVIKAVAKQTGHEITIRGNVTVSLIPQPTIYMPGVELRSGASESSAPVMAVEMVRMRVSPLSLFSATPKITGVALQGALLSIERGHNGAIQWDWLNSSLLETLSGLNDKSSISLQVNNGKILYHNNVTDEGFSIQDIYAQGTTGSDLGFSGSLSMYGHDLQFNLYQDSSVAVKDDAMPVTFMLSSDNNKLDWKGGIKLSASGAVLDGAVNLDVEDMLHWLNARRTASAPEYDRMTGELLEAKKDNSGAPLKISAHWAQKDTSISLTEVQLQGMNSAGAGKIGFSWNELPTADVEMEFSAFDYGQWERVVTDFIKAQPKPVTTPQFENSDELPVNPIPEDIHVNVKITAEKLYLGSQVWQSMKLNANLDEGTITVDQFTIHMPGESTLSLFGVVSQSGAKGIRFEGGMETEGKSLREMLTVFDASASELPETGFGDFYVRSNIFVSSEQVRLSEADAKISELRLGGGMVAYFDSNPRLEADMKLKDINFDYFRDVWRERQQKEGRQEISLNLDKSFRFDWLKKLRTTIDFKVAVERFTFLERKGDTATFRFFAREGELGVYNLRFYYPGETLEASFTLDVKSGRPQVNILLNTLEFNTDYLSIEPAAIKEEIKEEKQEEVKKEGAKPEKKEQGEEKKEVDIIPQAETIVLPETPEALPAPPPLAQTVEDLAKGEVEPEKAAAAAKKVWPEDLIDMDWMEGINAAMDISIGKLTHGDKVIRNVKLRARLDNNLLTFQPLSFDYWQGRWEVNGSLYGGTVPGISISFTLYNAELKEILKSLFDRTNINGSISVSGTLATSGINYLSWLSQSEAKLLFAGRGVTVDGINLQGVVDAVAVSRTASDVLNNVNLALTKGSTEFSVDGNINVKNGVMRTPGITLKTGTITGNLSGEVKLVPWTMDLSTFYQFPAMTSETVPTMTVQITGPLNDAELQADTASLEAYVVKRIIGR